MQVLLGNHGALRRETQPDGTTRVVGVYDDGILRVTRIVVPDWDDGSTHPDAEYEGEHPHRDGHLKVGKLKTPGPRLGGYTHKPGGLSVADFKEEFGEVVMTGRPFRLPDHEAIISVTNAWREHGATSPAWVQVDPTDPADKEQARTASDLEAFLHELWQTDGGRAPASLERDYWTFNGVPGEDRSAGGVILPPRLEALFTNDGRNQQALNYGGGLAGTSGTATGTAAGTITTGAITSVSANAYAGFRIMTPTAWANIISHTSGTTPVFTIDRWYSYATPGGSAASTPGSTTTWVIPDGGMVSAWFVGLTTTVITPAAADHTLSGEYAVASGGFLRKIAPYALTSGTSPMGLTLTPVFTANGSDTLPSTFQAAGAFCSMVVGFGGAGGPMKWESLMSASVSVAAVSDQVTLAWSEAGS